MLTIPIIMEKYKSCSSDHQPVRVFSPIFQETKTSVSFFSHEVLGIFGCVPEVVQLRCFPEDLAAHSMIRVLGPG